MPALDGPASHPVQRRYRIERLMRQCSAQESTRVVASQRSGRIDANPHQIDAVVFALERIPEGGCILADEVGLGKTIEAGLVIAQLRAEGTRRFLLVTPKSLLGQWQHELFTLFGIRTDDADAGFQAPGVYLVSRDFAGSARGSAALRQAPAFDLCVIDEAHEVFASVYKRFDRHGNYREDSKHAIKAGRVRTFLQGTPVLLLTATPIQNSLAELWGLAQWVEPTGTLFGDLQTFRHLFCDSGDDRRLARGQEDELRGRVAQICQRTLRRQAQEFMKKPFVGRRTRLFEYRMSAAEKALYDDVTEYLLDPATCAFRGNHRRLVLIGFHRRMASSLAALAASLDGIIARLRRMRDGSFVRDALDAFGSEILDDLEDDLRKASDKDEGDAPSAESIDAELLLVRDFADRARALPSDGKARALLEAVRLVMRRGEAGEGRGKVVIFTESLATQDFLCSFLTTEAGLDRGEVTLFRGTNEGAEVEAAYRRWQTEVGAHMPPPQPSQDVARRLALVHEFRTRSRVFVATEAGAKGLNLQFADTLINYDLPWNPQRIEQRIGRIHRYGQTTDVTVINFVSPDNATQRLTFDILSQKLDLFGTVLDASDQVLHEPGQSAPEPLAGALGAGFESSMRRIYERARSRREIEVELSKLREETGEQRARFEEVHRHTAGLIASHFDEQVRAVFRRIRDALPERLRRFDRELEAVLVDYLRASSVRFAREEHGDRVELDLAASPELPTDFARGGRLAIGDCTDTEADPVHLGHPLLHAARERARREAAGRFRLRFSPTGALRDREGTCGRLRVLRFRKQGFETVERLLPVVLLADDPQPLRVELAEALLLSPAHTHDGRLETGVRAEDFEDAVQAVVFATQREIAALSQVQYERRTERLERAFDDRILLLERQLSTVQRKLLKAHKKRTSAVGAHQRGAAEATLRKLDAEREELEAEIERLRLREDPAYERQAQDAWTRRYAAPEVETLFDVEFVLA